MRLRTEGVTWQEIDGELVILDMESSAYLTTNITGACLAKKLRDNCSLDDLTNSLMVNFGIDRATASTDAAAFVGQLREKRLLDEA